MNVTSSPTTPADASHDAGDTEGAAQRFDVEDHDGADGETVRAEAVPDDADGPARHRTRPASDAAEEQLLVWIDAIIDHDELALTALYDATVSRVYAIVQRVVRRPALAEEVVEDTYFQVWRQAARFDPARGRPLVWLLGMARSRAIDVIRREARFQHESLDADSAAELEDTCAPADDLLDVARCHADLHRALMLLNAQPRQLVALAFLRGMSHEEIADHTTLPLGTVKSQIRRALITLRQALGERSAQLVAA